MRTRPLVLLALFLVTVPTFARIGTSDVAPSATLLFPSFQVDTTDPNGINTLLTVQNASATAMLLNVTLWTDWGIPTDNFHIYLTGYDQETIDLFGLFNRAVPVTATDGQDPMDTISPQGMLSQDINFASCTGILTAEGQQVSPQLAPAHRGEAASELFGAGNCGGRNYGDGIARGYVTVDTVNNCQSGLPGSPGYFAPGGTGSATNQNTLLGDFVIVDRATGRAYADTAVHIEADPLDPLTSTPGNATFYGRLVANLATDNREPLPSQWAGTSMTGRTTIDYFRDPAAIVTPVPCGNTPAAFPLSQEGVTPYTSTGASTPVAASNYFPWAAGTVAAAPGGIPTTAKLGWIFLDLDTSAGLARQSWVTFRHLPDATAATTPFGVSVPGIQISKAP